MPIQATAIDGPREHPNGLLKIEILARSDESGFFHCLVLEVMESTGRTSKVGEIVKIHRHNIIIKPEQETQVMPVGGS